MSVNDWCEAGLTIDQFKNDSKRGQLTIFRRGTKGNTLIDVRSIRRIDRRAAIECVYGKIEDDTVKTGLKNVLPDQNAANFYMSYRDDMGKALTSERQQLYINGAMLMNTLMRIRSAQVAARARGGVRKKMKDWWKECVDFVKENSERYPNVLPLNVRRFEEKFNEYVKDGYSALVKKTNSDGTKLNYYYRDDNGKVATCNVYEVVDVYSEVLLGYHISASEDYNAQYNAFKMAMKTSGHKPYEVRFDNQGGHKKLESSSLFAKMAHLSISCQPYNGKSKTIESIFGRFQASFLHKEWYFTGQNITAKKRESRANMEFISANAKNLPTIDEVKKQYEMRRDEWNSAKHPDTGVPRMEMYRSSSNEMTTSVGIFDIISIFGLMNPKPIKYRSNGIVMKAGGVKYQYEVMDEKGQPDFAFLKSNVDREFFVEYVPDDMSVVALYEETATGEKRFVRMAEKYISVHRAVQEQDEFDHAFIKAMDNRNKKLRTEMVAETEDILERNGLHPSQHGLVMPKPKGNFGRKDDEVEPGKVMKRESCLVESVDDGGSIYDLY